MTFWTENSFDPKRAMRFKVSLLYGTGESPVPYFYVKDFAKPNWDTKVTTHKVAGREFHFPGSVSWAAVKATFVDDTQNTVLSKIVDVIANSGYPDIIRSANSAFRADGNISFVSKQLLSTRLTTAQSSAQSVQRGPLTMAVSQLDASGNSIETWTLYNPIIEKFEMDGLDYGKEELSTYSLTFRYDWASFSRA